jgi:hypothetical protein
MGLDVYFKVEKDLEQFIRFCAPNYLSHITIEA